MGFGEWIADKLDKFWPLIIRVIVYGFFIGIFLLACLFLINSGVITLNKALPDCSELNISDINLACESDRRLSLSAVYIGNNTYTIEQNKTYICKKVDIFYPGIYPSYLKCYQFNMTFEYDIKKICQAYCD